MDGFIADKMWRRCVNNAFQMPSSNSWSKSTTNMSKKLKPKICNLSEKVFLLVVRMAVCRRWRNSYWCWNKWFFLQDALYCSAVDAIVFFVDNPSCTQNFVLPLEAVKSWKLDVLLPILWQTKIPDLLFENEATRAGLASIIMNASQEDSIKLFATIRSTQVVPGDSQLTFQDNQLSK